MPLRYLWDILLEISFWHIYYRNVPPLELGVNALKVFRTTRIIKTNQKMSTCVLPLGLTLATILSSYVQNSDREELWA